MDKREKNADNKMLVR